MYRITQNMVKGWISTWNEYNPDIPMTCTFSWQYAAIGHRGEHNSIDVVASGSTPREAWEKFCCWKAGYGYAERKFKGE